MVYSLKTIATTGYYQQPVKPKKQLGLRDRFLTEGFYSDSNVIITLESVNKDLFNPYKIRVITKYEDITLNLNLKDLGKYLLIYINRYY